jgi:hypothetical protein
VGAGRLGVAGFASCCKVQGRLTSRILLTNYDNCG